MQFKHPEILYFLFALIIPILVHLFQLQRYKKTVFTNVALLQKLVLQTRKSSQLKKWLILAMRMLLFSAIIFAFSQPYFSNQKEQETQNIFIYLDNSLSLNSNGKNGNLLQNSIKEIIENISDKLSYSLLTNSNLYKNISSTELKSILLNTTYEAKNRSLEEVLRIIKNKKTKETNTSNNTLLISDFQENIKIKNTVVTNVTPPIHFIKLKHTQQDNLSIDSLFIDKQNNRDFLVNVVVKNQGNQKNNIPIALYNDVDVFSKQTFSIKKDQKKTISFPIQNTSFFKGKVTINFNDAFAFDNHHFFTVNSTKKIAVLSIGDTHHFLSKIYTKNEFNLTKSTLKNIDYNLLPKQELIILNEVNKIPKSLVSFLENHLKENKSLVIIPSKKPNLNSYNSLFKKLKFGRIQSIQNDSLRITDINHKNPFFKGVFTKKVKNLQSPIVKNHLKTNLKQTASLLLFDNQKSFVSQLSTKKGKFYWFSSAINSTNSNFKNSPLIVPLFYNFAQKSAKLPKTSYIINQTNTIDIFTKLDRNQVLSISNNSDSFIPLQESHNSKTTLTTEELPITSGFYEVKKSKETIQVLAFNYPKEESLLQFTNIQNLIKDQKNLKFSESVAAVFKETEEKNKVTWVWKWFLALAIVSLFFEILILKFFKP